jgi:AcrR family transcriptional regulator
MFARVNIKAVTVRTAYHHGDLRNALIAAAAELADQGGPAAVTIRAAARAVGVTPTAAYRHFKNHLELLGAARAYALTQMGDAMRARLAAVEPRDDPAEAAIARMDAMGRGYVDFALSRPGLFRSVFIDVAKPANAEEAEGPHMMLVRGVDELIALGFVSEEFRVGVEVASWSLVHGLALLMLEGPLSRLPEAERQAVVEQSLDTFVRTFWAARANFSPGT